ncbi:hypothetical protein MIND_00346100 [Mycena indigotica]|uniref:Catalase core domain-containing protein n=1 Tax=Mycena indigotica TaxID=2126181 RepID=A0A8H6T2F1_9AGAR|nr:uncharacterized protein MIND_00346100 [Mycena indigotica]KAF7309743.1 hypothetical protein MIND_00346100 [Mycena indigotica]
MLVYKPLKALKRIWLLVFFSCLRASSSPWAGLLSLGPIYLNTRMALAIQYIRHTIIRELTRSIGSGGPLLLQDFHLVDLLSHFDRERIPERVSIGSGS